jgi:serine/threonine-protein kinase
MGQVWRAWDRIDQRDVAAKLLLPELAQDNEVLTRFLREKAILVALHHPHIVRVHDFVAEGQNLAIIMDWVPGGSLGERLRQAGPLAPALATAVMAPVFEALAYAHGQGVMHRDIKPDNVLLSELGEPRPAAVRIGDFGIAQLAQRESAKTTGVLGTPLYMAPEYLHSGDFTPAADIYAAGVMWYELMAGRTPFAGPGTDITIGLRQLQKAPPPLPVTGELWAILDQLLAKDPSQRPDADQAGQLLRELPPEILSYEPLPRQPTPAEWVDAGAPAQLHFASGAGQTRQIDRLTVPPTGDEAVTSAKAASPGSAKSPGSATSEGVVEVPELPDFGPAPVKTEFRPRPTLATLTAAEPKTEGESAELPWWEKYRRWLIIGAGALVVIVGLVVALWQFGVFDSDEVEPIPEPVVSVVPAHVLGQASPAGLRLDWAAVWNPAESATELTLTAEATGAHGLRGDVMVVIPPWSAGETDGADCPNVALSPDSRVTMEPLTKSKDGTDVQCGYKFLDLRLDQSDRLVLQLRVTAATPPTDYSAWLQSIVSQTNETLREAWPGASRFPLQRLLGLRVEASSVTLTGGEGIPVPYYVYPVWPGDNEAGSILPEPIFQYETLPVSATTLLSAITGGDNFDAVTVISCNETMIIDRYRVRALQPTDRCALTVQVGELDGQGSFAIEMQGS